MTNTEQIQTHHQPFIEWLEIAYGDARVRDLSQLPAELQKTMFPLIAEFGPAADSVIPFYENITLLLEKNKHLTYPLAQFLTLLGKKSRDGYLKGMKGASFEALHLNERFLLMADLPGHGIPYEVRDGIYAAFWVLSGHRVLPSYLDTLTQSWVSDTHQIIMQLDNVVSAKGLRKR